MNTELTPRQVSEIAGVSVRTVYSWIKRGVQGKKLQAAKKQGRVVILKPEFEQFMKDTTQHF